LIFVLVFNLLDETIFFIFFYKDKWFPKLHLLIVQVYDILLKCKIKCSYHYVIARPL